MNNYRVLSQGNIIAEGTAKELAKIFDVDQSTIRRSYKDKNKLRNQYDVVIVEQFKNIKSLLTSRQKELIEEKNKQGQTFKQISYDTGIDEIDVKLYLNELERKNKPEVDIEKLIEDKINEKLKALNSQPLEAILTLKALGYEFNDNDKRFHLKDDFGNNKKTIQLSNNTVHIRKLDKANNQWSTPYTITYDEIEAIYNEITEKRGY